MIDTTRLVVDGLREPRAETRLHAVVAARELVGIAQEALQVAVDQARRAGHTWQEIGDILHTTRQAAFQRFGRPVDPRTGEPMSNKLLPGAADKAVELMTELSQNRWEAVRRDFDPTMAAQLDADRVAAAWAQVTGMVGRYEGMGDPFARQLGDYTVVDVPLEFEAGQMTGRVSYTQTGQVAGLYILQPEAAAKPKGNPSHE